MTTMNNFNTNDNHVDIKIACYLNSEEQQENFNSNFIRLNDEILLFTEQGQLTTIPETVNIDSEKNSRNRLVRALAAIEELDTEDYPEEDYNEHDLVLSIETRLPTFYDKDNHTGAVDIANNGCRDLDRAGIKYTTPLIIGSQHPFSQSDYFNVVVCQELAGRYKEEELQRMIDSFLWDVQIYCCVTINGEDYYIDGFNASTWDKEEAAEQLTEVYDGVERDYVKETVLELLPECPTD